jgi:4-amino-4-deoxy-L-arabinose transferase-like glycosyltransferase
VAPSLAFAFWAFGDRVGTKTGGGDRHIAGVRESTSRGAWATPLAIAECGGANPSKFSTTYSPACGNDTGVLWPSPMRRRATVTIGFCVLAYLICALPYLDRWPPPDIDEAIFANPALNLIHYGNFGSSAMAGVFGMGRVTFWFLPLHSILLIIPIELFGFHLWSVRLLSVVLGLGTLIVLHRLSRTLGASENAATLLVLFVGTDFDVLGVARFARMEALLGFLQSAVLLCLIRARQSEHPKLLVLGGVLAGASLLTHPLGASTILAFLVLFFPRREDSDGTRDWGRWRSSALLFAAGMCAALLPYVTFIIREGLGEFWKQMVVYQTYCYKLQGFWGGPLDRLGELLRLLRSTVSWEFFLFKICLLGWLAWPPKGARSLFWLGVSNAFLLLLAWPSTLMYYWIPMVYLPLAACAVAGKVSSAPGGLASAAARLRRAGVAFLFAGMIACNLVYFSRRLVPALRYDPGRSLAELRSLVAKRPGRPHKVLGSTIFLFALPTEDFRALFVVSSAIDFKGLSSRQALAEVSPDIIIVDGVLASGAWPAFFFPPDGLRAFLFRNGRFLGAAKSGWAGSPTEAEVFEVDPALFSNR